MVQEVLSAHFAGVPSKRVPKDAPLHRHILAALKIDSKVIKMGLYGVFVSAPLGHYLVGLLQKAFAGKTSRRDKLLQIMASNFIVSPVQISGASCRQDALYSRAHVYRDQCSWPAWPSSTARRAHRRSSTLCARAS